MGRPRPCQGCGTKPRAQRQLRLCYDCLPGGPFVPPPCARCGATEDYYASGLCGRCHLHGPQQVDSCRDCHAWGATRTHKWLCTSCVSWVAKYKPAICNSCSRSVASNGRGFCRLCWRHALGTLDGSDFDPIGGNRHGQQLFFADMFKARRLGVRPAPVETGPTRPLRPVTHRQLVLFRMAPDLGPGRGVAPAPRDKALADALDVHVTDYADRQRWLRGYTSDVRAGIRIMLGLQDTSGAPISAVETGVLTQLRLPVRSILAVLAEVGMLDDDRIPATTRWFERKVAGLAGPMAAEVRTWFDVMVNGSTTPPRRRPRSEITAKSYLIYILPALTAWSDQGHVSLREITRNDVLAVLPSQGTGRSLCGRGLGSLFGILKDRRLVFADPTSRLHTWTSAALVAGPVDLDLVRDALVSPKPERAILAALIAFHGLRSGELRNLVLTDLADRHLHLNGRVIPLAPPVRERLAAYLDHRQARWPNSTNPHLFIHFRTTRSGEAVGQRWIKLNLDLPFGARALRQDRILHEAAATDGDSRRLCDLFGLGIQQAGRYTDAVTEPDLPPARRD